MLWALTGCLWISDDDLADWQDRDGDQVPWPEDCDDEDPAIPAPTEICEDGLDGACVGQCEASGTARVGDFAVWWFQAFDREGDGRRELALMPAGELQAVLYDVGPDFELTELVTLEELRVYWSLGDLDGDRRDDLWVSDSSGGGVGDTMILFGDGGTWEHPQGWMTARPLSRDVDGDGLVEVIWSGIDDEDTTSVSSLASGQSVELFSADFPSWRFVGMFGRHAALDIDGDGDTELALGTASSAPAVLLVDHEGTLVLEQPGLGSEWMNAGDLDGDGYEDLLTGGTELTAAFFAGSATPELDADWSRYMTLESAELTDLQGDGFVDIVRQTGTGTVQILLGPVEPEEIAGEDPDFLAYADATTLIGDIDGDGVQELVVADEASKDIGEELRLLDLPL